MTDDTKTKGPTWLKTEHGMGHGHANAWLAYYLAAENGK
ncbi:DUF4287 domain-containing protein [Pseudomonas sp. ArH3a]|nr:DUF4287 domain-containing protein [Pseudomonas sp. ArH3a]UNM17374.1 DUF4287 domain-containing protein [Pseudomonas sp. ArH3a]